MKGESWKRIADELSKVIGEAFSAETVRSVGGGCINEAAILSSGSREVFVKKNVPSCFDMFEVEAAGLRTLGATILCGFINSDSVESENSLLTDFSVSHAQLHLGVSDTSRWLP